MKSLFNSYIALILVALVPLISSCEQEMVEPMMPTTEVAEAKLLSTEAFVTQDKDKFKDGNYIVQFNDDATLQTNQDIENLAEEIAGADLTLTDVFNFEGFKGFTGYLTKQQARNFNEDARVLVIEADAPINPLQAR